MDIRSLYMDLYDGSVDRSTGSRQTKTSGKYYIEDPAISLLCGSTPQSIREFVGQSGFQNGFLARFLLLASHPAHECRYEWGDRSQEERLASIDELNQIQERVKAVMRLGGIMAVSKGAKDIIVKFDEAIGNRIKEFEWTSKSGMETLLARLPTMAAKIAMIHCAMREMPLLEMNEQDAQYAVNFCTFSANTLPHIYEHVEPDDNQNRDLNYKKRVLRVLRGMAKNEPDGLIKHSSLLRNSNLTKDQLKNSLETLKAEGCIIEERKGRGLAYRMNEIDESSY
jgi:hypothetical protein